MALSSITKFESCYIDALKIDVGWIFDPNESLPHILWNQCKKEEMAKELAFVEQFMLNLIFR